LIGAGPSSETHGAIRPSYGNRARGGGREGRGAAGEAVTNLDGDPAAAPPAAAPSPAAAAELWGRRDGNGIERRFWWGKTTKRRRRESRGGGGTQKRAERGSSVLSRLPVTLLRPMRITRREMRDGDDVDNSRSSDIPSGSIEHGARCNSVCLEREIISKIKTLSLRARPRVLSRLV
jgi:hypothetical protein